MSGLELPERLNAAAVFVDVHVTEGRGPKPAILCGDCTVTYQDLYEGVNRFGGALQELGVRMEERVAILLPDTPEFAGLRDMPGAFILAPGFGLKFTGNFGTVNGCMAADEFKWTGNAGGTVHGMIINYSDSEFKLTGNSHLIFDRSDASGMPPGFTTSGKFSPDSGTYLEH